MSQNELNYRTKIFPAVLGLSCLLLYWKMFSYPYIQDDWHYLYYFDTNPHQIIDPDETFFRPFGWLYFYLIVHLFGENPIGFRIVNFAALVSTSLVLKAISVRLLKNETLAWICASWFAISGTMLMDPMMWMVGMYDLGALFFFLLSVLFFLDKRPWLSASAYLAALLFKEGPILLPLILIAYGVLAERKSILLSFRSVLSHMVVMMFYSILWLTITGTSETHAYQVHFWGMHILTNTGKYALWTMEGLTGRANSHENWFNAVLITAAIIGFGLATWKSVRSRFRENFHLILLLLIWGVVCLLPVLFLPNQSYRYYLIYSYPAVLLLLVLHFNQTRLILLFLLLLFVSNLATLSFFLGRGLKAPVLSGSNALVQKGSTVQLMYLYVRQELKMVPKNCVFIFDGVDSHSKWFRGIDAFAFQRTNFLRYIYQDPSIDCINLRGKDYSAAKRKPRLVPETTVVLGLKEGKIQRYTLADLYNPHSAFYTDPKL